MNEHFKLYQFYVNTSYLHNKLHFNNHLLIVFPLEVWVFLLNLCFQYTDMF